MSLFCVDMSKQKSAPRTTFRTIKVSDLYLWGKAQRFCYWKVFLVLLLLHIENVPKRGRPRRLPKYRKNPSIKTYILSSDEPVGSCLTEIPSHMYTFTPKSLLLSMQ